MAQSLFVGVDGGATKCIVRVEDEVGNVLGQEISGPANIRISVDQAWQSIRGALNKILSDHSSQYELHAGMGLAGCELQEVYQIFLQRQHSFKSLVVTSDAHIACLGAHGGQDGAIIIAGTGMAGYQICQGKVSKVSGWGFPYDDEGGGAWIGLRAVMQTFQWLDGRRKASALNQAIYQHFQKDSERLINWANLANSTAFAELAPLVIQHSEAGDVNATQILQEAAYAIDKVGDALQAAQPDPKKILPCTLIGGVARFLRPLLAEPLKSRLQSSVADPVQGAVMLVREHVETVKEKL